MLLISYLVVCPTTLVAPISCPPFLEMMGRKEGDKESSNVKVFELHFQSCEAREIRLSTDIVA
jgi:hypothetical protein